MQICLCLNWSECNLGLRPKEIQERQNTEARGVCKLVKSSIQGQLLLGEAVRAGQTPSFENLYLQVCRVIFHWEGLLLL